MHLPESPTMANGPDARNPSLQLLHTVALEELSIAALLHAEAEKVQAVVAAGIPGSVTPQDIIEVDKGVAEVLRELVALEDRLLRKLAMVSAVKPPCPPCPPEPPCSPGPPGPTGPAGPESTCARCSLLLWAWLIASAKQVGCR